MNAPPPPRPPEPMATVWIARKPGAGPVDVIVGEAEAERAIADLSAALAAIRAGKQAIAGLLVPQAASPYPAGAVDATVYCGKRHPDSGDYCELDDGHPGTHYYMDASGSEVTWGDAGTEARFAAAAACPSRKDGEPCTVLGGHEVHYGPADASGVCLMWLDGEADGASIASGEAAAVLAASIASGQPLPVTDDEPARATQEEIDRCGYSEDPYHRCRVCYDYAAGREREHLLRAAPPQDDEPLPDCAACGDAEVLHEPQGQPVATGPCAACDCTAYALPQDDEPDPHAARASLRIAGGAS